ncbi:YihY/virulence factor BrkB family protein [Urbifossiella limnaea]|uniref:YihY/virulence factor BrkB family protein n=1 Tax=Urbifossiella limnaea TaxID=2528023 RepID=A0A517XPV2_9BACT|nr:YihY/virulence factor BrkB family protein [Urbifossiella limnaea]QDU19522.1 ribonuclease BN/unknown domain fusion protein [Urbifossiella limnaea]
MKLRVIWDVVREAGEAWLDDRAPRIAAALAFFSALSIAPLLVIALAMAGAAYGDRARGEVAAKLTGLVGEEAAAAVGEIVANARWPEAGVVAIVVSLVTLVVGATGVFVELQEALNDVWGVRPKPGRPVRTFVLARVASLGMGVAIGILLLASLVLTTATEAAGRYAAGTVPGAELAVRGANLVTLFGFEAALFAMLFKFLPHTKLHWRDVGVGALLTAVLFTVGKVLIGVYLRHTVALSAFGAAGSLMAFLVWLYYSALVFVFGAEVTKVTARRGGRAILPTRNAEAVKG